MGSSVRNMQNAKNRIIAINIAREGVEAMRNIRDTNWLKFQSRRRQCWNNLPTKNPSVQCTGANPIEPGDYIIYKQGDPLGGNSPTYRWRLGESVWQIPEAPKTTCAAADEGDTYANNADGFTYICIKKDGPPIVYKWENIAQVNVVDIDSNVDTDLDNDKLNDKDFLNHLYPKDEDALGTLVSENPFRRIIRIDYINNNGDIESAGTNADWNRMRIRSIVTWQSVRSTFTVELTTHLTDYLGREKLSG